MERLDVATTAEEPTGVDVNGLHWTFCEGQVTEVMPDCIYERAAEFKCPNKELSILKGTPWYYYYLMYPVQLWKVAVAEMNRRLEAESTDSVTLVTVGEYIRFRGIRLASVFIGDRGNFVDYWRTPSEESESIRLAQNFGERFGMSKNRFMELEHVHAFCSHPKGEEYEVRVISLFSIS